MPASFVAAGRWTVRLAGEEGAFGERVPARPGTVDLTITVVAAGGTLRGALRMSVPVVDGRETVVRPMLLLDQMRLSPAVLGGVGRCL